MSERNANVIRTAETLLNDLHYTDEWDVPPRMYLLGDDPEDPSARYIGQLNGHPATALEGAYEQGFHCSEKVHGLIVTTEAYRHYTLEEIITEHPDVLERMKEVWIADGTIKADEDVSSRLHKLYYEGVMPSLPDPGLLPETMRKEVRVATVVLRDGTSFSGATTRGADAEASVTLMPDTVLRDMTVPNRMYQLLHDVRPTECDDPIKVVAEAKSEEKP